MTRGAGGEGATVTMGAEDLLRTLSPLGSAADIDTRDLLGKPSASMDLADLACIACAVEAAQAEERAVVISHGSDTIEETAFALALTVPAGLPIVLTAAMRAADSPGADGPANLLTAIRVAASIDSHGTGVVLVANDEIHSALFLRKAHSFRIHAFSSAPFGPIGWVAEGRVRICLRPIHSMPLLRFGGSRAVVPIIEAGSDLEPEVIAGLSSAAIDGLVLGLPGGGHVADGVVEPLCDLASRIPVVFATRTGAGETLRSSYGYPGSETDLLRRGLIGAGRLDVRKTRMALQLLLSNAADKLDIRDFFSAT